MKEAEKKKELVEKKEKETAAAAEKEEKKKEKDAGLVPPELAGAPAPAGDKAAAKEKAK